MQGIVIGLIVIILYVLIIKNKIKLNIISLFFLSLVGISIFHLINNERNKVTYVNIASPQQITEIWSDFSNHQLANDVQLTRTLNPYKVINKQVREPNQVVHDKNYIYSISSSKVVITNIDDLKVRDEITYIGQPFKPMFLYITEDKLVVVGEAVNKTRTYIYHKDDFEELKNFQIDATYVTSRLIDEELFVITSKIIENKKQSEKRPVYTENGEEKYIPIDKIYYINQTYPNNYVNIIKTNINQKDNLEIMSYLGLGQVIYFSPTDIFIAEEKYAKETGNSNKTIIIKINQKDLRLSGLQQVPGYVLDQYSLNEYKGHLRIATSTSDEDHMKDSNNIYILDNRMKIVGKLEGFSVGNEIQAAVFIKDKAYIETFNIIDPFYVIDLSDEKKPKIISEIKFEGYNTNFVPYDENYILAFGLLLNQDKQSTGLKISLYDVSNPNQVKIVSKDTILYKDYNSAYTDVLYDCKSLLLDRKHHILGFPIIYWIDEPGTEVSYYKQFYALYKIDQTGLKKLGKVSHYEKGKYNNVSDDIKKGLVLDQALYTVSDKLIKKNALYDLKLLDEVYLR